MIEMCSVGYTKCYALKDFSFPYKNNQRGTRRWKLIYAGALRVTLPNSQVVLILRVTY